MNTFVWVMLVYSHAGNWIPTLEFKEQEKCVAAAVVFKTDVDARKTWGNIGMLTPRCLRIEK